jgi:hypothetical protein
VLLLVFGIVAELFAASQIMPYNDLSAPEAYNAPRLTIDQLRAYHEGQIAPGRVLGISGLLFDPGDRAYLEARYGAMALSPEAVRLAFVAIKMKETLAPNLPLAWGIPGIDGFDGGLLPTAYYSAFTSLLLPEGVPRTLDGRIGEILTREPCRGACIPDSRWLNLTNTQYLITDKVFDLWREDVAYDTQFATSVSPARPLILPRLPDFQATALDVLYVCADSACSPPDVSTDSVDLSLAFDEPAALDVYQLTRFALPEPSTLSRIEISADVSLTIRALTLVDTRTGAFVQLTPEPWTRVLSSDVKIYENETVLPRAFVTHEAWVVAGDERGTEEGLDLMRAPDFDPAAAVVLSSGDAAMMEPVPLPRTPASESSAKITFYGSERVVVEVDSAAEGYLVLTDAFYPGWQATLNGAPAEILRADVMFRAVHIPAGHSEAVFEYRPAWLPGALVVGAVGWVIVAVVVMVGAWGVRIKNPSPSPSPSHRDAAQ